MTRIGLTQRVDVVESYGERRDCLDQAWTSLLDGWGYQPVPLPNTIANPHEYLDSMDLAGLVLTGGNDLAHLDSATQPAPERDAFERAALDWAIDRAVPTLGVCRGIEVINVYFGGTLSTVSGHVATTHSVSFELSTLPQPLDTTCDLPDETRVNSYHNHGISPEDVADELLVLATASDETIEALFHPTYPLLGIMWHPERDTTPVDVDHKLFNALF